MRSGAKLASSYYRFLARLRLKIAVSTMEMPNASVAAAARALLAAIEARHQYIRLRYKEEVKMDPDLYGIFRMFDQRGF